MGSIRKKKILLLSTGDVNGAYEALYKTAEILIAEGHEIVLFVKHKSKSDFFIKNYTPKQLSLLDRITRKFSLQERIVDADPQYAFISTDENIENIDPQVIVQQAGIFPDVIITGMTIGFLNSTDLYNLQKYTQAQVYNLTVDMNHFTGGCHFAWDCKGYINGCTVPCPALKDEKSDLAKRNFETKFENARKGNFKIIAGSGWTLKQAEESKIYGEQDLIGNVNSLIDTKILNPHSRAYARKIFSLEENTFYILMGCQHAGDPRKGFDYLVEALKILALNKREKDREIVLLVVSRSINHNFESVPFEKKHIDYIKDYRLLSLLYQAVDVFVNTSIEDSGPMMVSEALACGTPVVGFDMGVVNNMVITGYNGYKAELKNSNDLAKGIEIIYNLDEEQFSQYSKNAVRQVEEFSSFAYASKVLSDIFTNSDKKALQ